MQIGIDSYATVIEADAYITARYRSTDDALLRWTALEDTDKEILLLNACTEIEALPFHGRKVLIDQLLAFPRLPYQELTPEAVPENVKNAQIEYALWLSNDDKQRDAEQRAGLQAQGVTSFSIGDLSENYGAGAAERLAPLLCPKVKVLLSPYLNGGHVTC